MSVLVTSRERMDSSLMRSNAPATFFKNPSWVWLKETALAMFGLAALMRLICASKWAATACPATSSSGEMSFGARRQARKGLAEH